jgi:hypothetical protein
VTFLQTYVTFKDSKTLPKILQKIIEVNETLEMEYKLSDKQVAALNSVSFHVFIILTLTAVDEQIARYDNVACSIY